MHTLRYAVIGHPIGHTMSPFIHSRLFDLAGISAVYDVFDIPPQELLRQEAAMLRELDGYNLTIPHKTVIIPALDALDEKAKLYGSVNTVKNGSVKTGSTTDPYGFLMALRGAGIPLAGHVAVLGSGGVARVFVYEAALAGCEVTIAVRPSGRQSAEALAASARAVSPGCTVTVCELGALDCPEENDKGFDLLINATPVGMYPNADASPVGDGVLRRTGCVFDAVYNPQETLLLRMAHAQGCRVLGGMPMLVWQAVQAHTIWNGSRYRQEDIDQLCEDALAQMRKQFG